MPIPFRSIPSRWESAILVCGRCSKRAGGGFGPKGRQSLAKVLRQAGLGGRGRKAERGVVETRCLKLCPKHAVAAIDMRAPGRWLVVPLGADADALIAAFGEAETAPGTPT